MQPDNWSILTLQKIQQKHNRPIDFRPEKEKRKKKTWNCATKSEGKTIIPSWSLVPFIWTIDDEEKTSKSHTPSNWRLNSSKEKNPGSPICTCLYAVLTIDLIQLFRKIFIQQSKYTHLFLLSLWYKHTPNWQLKWYHTFFI